MALPPAVVPIVTAPEPPDRNPAEVYLRGKPSATGRRGLQRSLERAAEILTGGVTTDALAVNWTEVRYQHLMAMRSLLLDTNAKPATINHTLAAVRGTLREAWRLGYLTAEDWPGLPTCPTSRLPCCRLAATSMWVKSLRCSAPAAMRPVGARDAAMLAAVRLWAAAQ